MGINFLSLSALLKIDRLCKKGLYLNVEDSDPQARSGWRRGGGSGGGNFPRARKSTFTSSPAVNKTREDVIKLKNALATL
jgi:hypothetical protein